MKYLFTLLLNTTECQKWLNICMFNNLKITLKIDHICHLYLHTEAGQIIDYYFWRLSCFILH